MKFFLFAIAVGLWFSPKIAVAATTDLAIPERGVYFSTDITKLIAGTTVRVYTKIRNVGQTDVSGNVVFFQGDKPIGPAQAISLIANGASEEVFVDFVVPESAFNIRVQIDSTEPTDQNPQNNVSITQLITPVKDQDRDSVPDAQDNCPSVGNAQQENTDGDALGDACDEDDDNDSLTDAVEAELGTNPRRADSDGDGVTDPQDAYPNDASKTKIPPPEPPKPAPVSPPVPAVKPPTSTTVAPAKTAETSPSTTTTPTTTAVSEQPQDEQAQEQPQEAVQDFVFSPKAIFRYERLGWNRYQFEALSPDSPGYRYAWDFGDGVTSNKKSVSHTYHGYGEFKVVLSVTDPERVSSEDSTTIVVSFFSIQNRAMEVVIGLLSLLLLLGLAAAVRFFKKSATPHA